MDSSGAAVACHGPMPQAHFLAGLGAMSRLEALLALADGAQADALLSGARRLMGGRPPEGASAAAGERDGCEQDEGMGYCYQAMAISPAGLPPPAPFGPLAPEAT